MKVFLYWIPLPLSFQLVTFQKFVLIIPLHLINEKLIMFEKCIVSLLMYVFLDNTLFQLLFSFI